MSMKKLSPSTKLIFGSADLFGGGALNMVGFYYLIFLIDVLQISPAYAGVIVLVSRAWDAVSDPLMGVLVDRTRTRIGKRRPYFFVGIGTVFVAIVLLWHPVAFAEEAARFLFALFAFLFFSTVSTTVMIPYLSMQPELTDDYHERTSLNLYKMAFSFLAGILAALFPMQIVAAFPDIRTGYRVMGLCFAALYALPWLGIALHIKERDNRSDPPPPRFSLADFIAPLRIRTFRLLIGIYLGAFLTLDIMSSMIAFALTHVFGRPEVLNLVLGALIVCQLFFLPFLGSLTRRYGKHRVLVGAAMVWIVGVTGIAFAPAAVPTAVLMALAAFSGIGVSGSLVVPWTMYPDAVDVGYLVIGRDIAGSFSGLMIFFRKTASAAALFLVGFFLDVAGYVKPIQETVNGVTTNTNVTQSAAVLLTMRLLLCVLPFLLLGVVMLLARSYPLTHDIHGRLQRHIRYLKGEEDTPLGAEELENLKERLV